MAQAVQQVKDAIRLNMAQVQPVASIGTLEIHGRKYPVSEALAVAIKQQQQLLEESQGQVVQNVQPGTEPMEKLLQVGYRMDLAEARLIIKERESDPHTHPYEAYKRAKAMLAAFEGTPRVVSQRQGWKRDRVVV